MPRSQNILFEGKRASGVRYKDRSGKDQTVKARKEIRDLWWRDQFAATFDAVRHWRACTAGRARYRGRCSRSKVLARICKITCKRALVYKSHEPTLNDEVGSMFGQAKIGLKYITFTRWANDDGGKPCDRVPENPR